MEAIFFIVLFWVGINLIMGFFSSIFGDGNWSDKSGPSDFSVDLFQEFVSNDKTRLDCFTFKIKGKVGNPTGAAVKVIFRLSDTTNSDEMAAIYAIPTVYHVDNTGLFGMCQTLPAADPTTYLPESISFGSVPKEWLQYPYKGKRTIKALAFVVDAACDESNIESIKSNLIHYAAATSTLDVLDIGYMDNYQNRDKINELSIDLCMLMAASDGSLDQNEIDVMKDWSRLSYILIEDESEKSAKKNKISSYIKNSYQRAKKKELNQDTIIRDINEIFDTTAKYNLIELLLEVAGADDVFAKEEDKFLSSIVTDLSLDLATINEMKNKVVIGIKKVDSSEASSESLLGLTDDMTNEEKRKSLRKSYAKWNAQTTHKDINIRQRANEMIEIIAKLNIKYKN